MFCPNCGTQNPDAASTCAKCNFNLKASAGPKFKGTMLMMNQPNVANATPAPAPAPPPASPSLGASSGPATIPQAAMHQKLKGTMVGVAPPMPPGTLGTPAPAPVSPVAAHPHHPAAQGQAFQGQGAQGQMPQASAAASAPTAAFQAPPPPAYGPPSAVNPLGGTVAANMGHPFGGEPPLPGPPQGSPQHVGYGAPPAFGAQPGDAAGAHGGLGYGNTAAVPAFDAPAAPLPHPGRGYEAPDPSDPRVTGGISGSPGYGGYGAPSDLARQAPQAGGGGLAYAGNRAVVPGHHGPKGKVRNPVTVILLTMFTGIYGYIWFFGVLGEMRAYLQGEEPNALKILLLSLATCGFYGLYWQFAVAGPMIEEMERRAGLPDPKNPGILLVIPIYGFLLFQQELNRVWESPT